MGLLVDTSVWVAHFRQGDQRLVRLLEQDQVLSHPLVLLELACGTPPQPRQRILGDMSRLRQAAQANTTEVLAFIEREQLFGLGCGAVDLTLLASTLMTPGAKLWTLDRRLEALAQRLGVAARL